MMWHASWCGQRAGRLSLSSAWLVQNSGAQVMRLGVLLCETVVKGTPVFPLVLCACHCTRACDCQTLGN